MAINKNHEFEDLDGIKCAIVEKNVLKERVEFLKQVLEYNHYTVVVMPTPAPKAAVAKPPSTMASANPATTEAIPATPQPSAPPPPETFTVGVTDVTFNPINAIFGRLLKAPHGHIVTLAYWQQKEKEPHDETPYFEKRF